MNREPISLCRAGAAVVLWCIPLLGPAHGQFFDSRELITFTLEAPLTDLMNQRGEDPEYLPASLTYAHHSLGQHSFAVRVKARGNLRRREEVCRFPPIWIDFKKKQVVGSLFEGQDKIKLVTHCQERDSRFEQYLRKEYLAYRTFNLLTDRSFRVRPASVTYKDSVGRRKTITRFAFFIEPEAAVGESVGGEIVRSARVKLSRIDPVALNLVEVFQFMIGNSDFTMLKGSGEDRCCHNGRQIALPDPDAPLIPVPYDFDVTGIVSPPYALPNPKMPIRNVRERVYRGFCREDRILDDTMAVFTRLRPEIFDLWETYPGLNPKTRNVALRYLQSFYDVIDDPRERHLHIESKCRRRKD